VRRIAVASGKGGTGKTTIAAALAHGLTDESVIAIADCDVEASNLPIALDAFESSSEPFVGGRIARIDPRSCFGCGACVPYCPFGAILPPTEASATSNPTLAFSVDRFLCEGCGACTEAPCPNMALAMHPAEVGTVFSGTCTAGTITWARLEPGADLSGRLVTEVRKKAEAAAEETGAELLLIDGPPGIGCPATAAIGGVDLLLAVTEPTIAGVHDLQRLLDLALRLDLPVVVVLNKADLSKEGAEAVRDSCAKRGVTLAAELPFEERIARAWGGVLADEALQLYGKPVLDRVLDALGPRVGG
jgi:MinD superfamily P-loop ATPase